MPRCAVFSSDFLPYSQTFVYEEVRHHSRYDVEVFCRRRMLLDRFPFEPVHVGGKRYALTRYSSKFHELFRSRRYDLVHAHFGTGALYALPYVERYSLPLVVTFHGYDVPLLRSAARLRPQNWPYALLGSRMVQVMTLGVCASGELRELLIDYGVEDERLAICRVGIDLSAFAKGARNREHPTVLMIGRFVEKKGFEIGLRAFGNVIGKGQRARLVIVGDGERRGKLEALTAKLGIGAQVTFAGVLAPKEIASLLSTSDVLMAPSVVGTDGDRESGVLVVKEASASEVVPIGTYHGGIPEIIEDGTTGYLVPERDVSALSGRLELVLGDSDLRDRLGRAARRKMEREYGVRGQVAALEDLYDRAVRSARSAGN